MPYSCKIEPIDGYSITYRENPAVQFILFLDSFEDNELLSYCNLKKFTTIQSLTYYSNLHSFFFLTCVPKLTQFVLFFLAMAEHHLEKICKGLSYSEIVVVINYILFSCFMSSAYSAPLCSVEVMER